MRAASRAASDRSSPYLCYYFQSDAETGWSPSMFDNTYASFADAFEGKRVYSSDQDSFMIQDGMVAWCDESQ